MSDDEKNRTRALVDVAPADWDMRPLGLAHEIRGFLDGVKDAGTSIDSGTDGVVGNLWVTVQGVEYFIDIRKSDLQKRREAQSK